MAKLVFDEIGKRFYETGVSEAVLYPQDETGNYPKGVAWNGITSAKENPTGAEASEHYADNMLFFSITGPELLKHSVHQKNLMLVTVWQNLLKVFVLTVKLVNHLDLHSNRFLVMT